MTVHLLELWGIIDWSENLMSLNAIAIEDVALLPSHFSCIHVMGHTSSVTPFGTVPAPDWSQIECLCQRLIKRCGREGLSVEHAEPASKSNMPRRFFRQPTAIDWLVQNTQFSTVDAAKKIDEFPIHVSPLMCQNARNPLQFLGLAAALSKKPDVVMYSTCGMDPLGISKMHEFAPRQHAPRCLIHISTLEFNSRHCPPAGKCVVVDVC